MPDTPESVHPSKLAVEALRRGKVLAQRRHNIRRGAAVGTVSVLTVGLGIVVAQAASVGGHGLSPSSGMSGVSGVSGVSSGVSGVAGVGGLSGVSGITGSSGAPDCDASTVQISDRVLAGDPPDSPAWQLVLAFKNISSQPCEMGAFPIVVVAIGQESSKPVQPAAPSAGTPFTMQPGSTVYVEVSGGAASGTCPVITSLASGLPGGGGTQTSIWQMITAPAPPARNFGDCDLTVSSFSGESQVSGG
ncbi:MAG: DUF4232 domain-containing protein [Acidimicrobiales bacterium]